MCPIPDKSVRINRRSGTIKEVQVRMLIAELMNFRYSIQKETE